MREPRGPRAPWLAAALVPACLALACAPGEPWDYSPAVVGEEELAARLAPLRPGELVLVNFWASWCATCLGEMRALSELRMELEREGVRVAAVSLDLAKPVQVRTPEELAAFVEHRGYALTQLAYRGDYDALCARFHLPDGPPCTLVFGAQGELERVQGASDRAGILALVAAARERAGTPAPR